MKLLFGITALVIIALLFATAVKANKKAERPIHS